FTIYDCKKTLVNQKIAETKVSTEQTTTPIKANNNPSCADILTQAVQQYPGLESALVDHRNASLTISYNPDTLNPQAADRITLELSRQINQRRKTHQRQHKTIHSVDCAPLHPDDEIRQRVAVINKGDKLTPELKRQLHLTESHLARIEKRYQQTEKKAAPPKESWIIRNLDAVLTAISLITLLGGIISGALNTARNIQVAFFVISCAAGGYIGSKEGIQSLRELKFDVNLLMLAAAVGAAAIGAWEEGAVLLFLFSLSGTLEGYAMERTSAAIEKLMDLSPDEALVKQGEHEIPTPVENLLLGDVIIVKPGARLAADGEVLTGESEVDQSPITGESAPVNKKPGDPVFAGSINGQGAMEVEVTRLAQESALAKIVQMVSEAQSQRSPTQRAIDWFGSRYTVAVVLGALAMIVIPYFFMGWPFSQAFYRGMVLLVVASPCALVISTPASVLSAIANAAKNGILFKGGAHLENTGLVQVVAFDKTGTLTTGEPGVTNILPLDGVAKNELLVLAAAVEARSEHHLAKAIVRAAKQKHLEIPRAVEFQAMMGRGARALVGGQAIQVGKPAMFNADPAMDDLRSQTGALENEGKTVVIISREDKVIGLIGIADSARPAAKEMIVSLKQNGIQRVVMLTGDNPHAAKSIADDAGVDEFYAELLPQDKVRLLKELEAKYGAVAMVGDGVNDAPALAAATVGIAMGAAGTDVALETADLVLMADDLKKLPYAINLSRRSRSIIKQNLSFAGMVIALLIASSVFGLVPLTIGVIAHEGSTLLVVLNGLRLLKTPKQ
ncbi:MAG: hypothetical protein B6243_01200, partial [Anaerolineaceae bacterium 4572_5.2]